MLIRERLMCSLLNERPAGRGGGATAAWTGIYLCFFPSPVLSGDQKSSSVLGGGETAFKAETEEKQDNV